jgi:hypothetical protein
VARPENFGVPLLQDTTNLSGLKESLYRSGPAILIQTNYLAKSIEQRDLHKGCASKLLSIWNTCTSAQVGKRLGGCETGNYGARETMS